MFKLSVAVFCSTLIVSVSSAFISDVVNEFHFTKAENGSEEFNFEYKLDNGNTFHGQTFTLHGANVLLMFGENGVIYWTDIQSAEKTTFTKGVRIVERSNDTVFFKDDSYEYTLKISLELILVTPYATAWDLRNICFRNSKNVNQTFQFEITSTNNSRKYIGTTYSLVNDPLIQRIHIEDGVQFDGVYEIEFTTEEHNSATTFCRGYTNLISERGVLGTVSTKNGISKALLKSLAG